ncbi:MAG TPA: hypothetical protein VK097_01095 [Lentibacillus sp.]|uniref:hypothetical protein n=1 Tax=Lentibacillus sp. TaxID=1925746 RepID=UPI002B4B32D7|nr:hypothetical protein [Lentibacillus sp.]HLR61018.1 hypothetical protein [Lentibacillus sp.]
MKRYWRLIVIVTVVILTIGAFYIKSSLAAGNYPEFKIEKISGNERLINSVILNGNYTAGNSMGESVKVTPDGSEYNSNQSFIERIQGLYNNKIYRLQQEYRGFMRGKTGSITSYFEEEETLAYAEVINQSVRISNNDMEFDIAVLNKENDETISFTVPVPNRAMYTQVYVEDVQMTDDTLKVVTRNFSKDGGNAIYLYSFDIMKQEINEDERVAITGENENNAMNHLGMISASDQTAAQKYIIFSKDSPDGQDVQGYIVYNLETGEQRTLEPSQDLSGDALAYDNEYLYFSTGNQIVQYNIETDEITAEIDLPSQDTSNGDMQRNTLPMLHVDSDKMYLLTGNPGKKTSQNIAVIDTTTGETLYNGQLTSKKPIDQNGALHIFDIQIGS